MNRTWLNTISLWCKENTTALVVFGIALFLLFFRIGYRTFWMDETMVLSYLPHSLTGFWNEYTHNPDNHPPLYYFLVLLLSKFLPWNELMVRLTSVVSGFGIVVLVYIFMKDITKEKRTALIAAFFTAFSSYFILISQMARYHSISGFAALLTLYFFYRLFTYGFTTRTWWGFVLSFVFVGYVDYPHFVYVGLIVNAVYAYRLIRRRPLMPLRRWLLGQGIVAILCSPMVWFLYHRIVIQGDGGWSDVNLLANSWVHIIAGIFFHVYSYFFGEHIFPWNYFVFTSGCVVLLGILTGCVRVFQKKYWDIRVGYIVLLSMALMVLNTLIMNVADARYNFIVYPKFAFVAYPITIMAFVLCLRHLTVRTQYVLYFLWAGVAVIGLFHFYTATHYLNGSYYRTFESFEFVRDNANPGDRLAITPDAGEGLYLFYRETYFRHLTPLGYHDIPHAPSGSRVWFFSTGHDGPGESVTTESRVPEGYIILKQYDSVPLDPTFKMVKEKILDRPSYTYKYTVFLLQKV
ncbi:MAG TPA: glycosyltransferase family 39 protein [Candidatus Kapabacteria bacterium]|nr:glycosyltransferase family 39 protein [Candidatus Kapabacteria bacterium]